MLCRSKAGLTGKGPVWVALSGLILMLAACAESQTGVSTGSRAAYQTVAVVPRINDRLLSAYWENPWGTPGVAEASMGWNASRDAGQMAREILAGVGASATVTSSPTSAPAKAAQAVVLLEQTPLDALASNYDPGRDFLITASSLAAAASSGGVGYIIIDTPENYSPRMVLRITNIDGSNPSNPNVCVVGLTPSLVNPATGEATRKGRSLVGAEKLPIPLSGAGWSTFSASERATVLTYCQSALRRVVSQSFVELGVVK